MRKNEKEREKYFHKHKNKADILSNESFINFIIIYYVTWVYFTQLISYCYLNNKIKTKIRRTKKTHMICELYFFARFNIDFKIRYWKSQRSTAIQRWYLTSFLRDLNIYARQEINWTSQVKTSVLVGVFSVRKMIEDSKFNN